MLSIVTVGLLAEAVGRYNFCFMKLFHWQVAVVVLGAGCCLLKQSPAPSPEISIHEAIAADDFAAFNQHIAVGTDVNLKDSRWGNTPLIHASYHGRQKIIDRLVRHGANLNAQSNNGWTALHVAVGQEHLAVVSQLLRAGADFTVRNRLFGQGENQEQVSDTPLDLAINFDLPEITKVLRKHGAQTSAELKVKGQ
jgi:ankyrin repeat protein